MNWIAQLLNCAILVAFGAFLLWQYDRRFLANRRREAVQYRFFALRDRVIRLVADGSFTEGDPRWNSLYETMNKSATATHVDAVRSMSTGFIFARSFVNAIAAPNQRLRDEFASLPEPLKDVWRDWTRAVLKTCFESWLFRMAFKFAASWHVARIIAKWLAPQLYLRIRQWVKTAEMWGVKDCGLSAS